MLFIIHKKKKIDRERCKFPQASRTAAHELCYVHVCTSQY